MSDILTSVLDLVEIGLIGVVIIILIFIWRDVDTIKKDLKFYIEYLMNKE